MALDGDLLMAKLKFDGVGEYVSKLQLISRNTEPCLRRAVYAGAKVIADAIHTEIEALPEDRENFHATSSYMTSGISARQKEGLLNGLGISKIENDNGVVNCKVGFSGYNDVETDTYPHGQPNPLIARSVISGTSFRQKNPFVTRAVKKSKAQAEDAMNSAFDAEFEKISN